MMPKIKKSHTVRTSKMVCNILCFSLCVILRELGYSITFRRFCFTLGIFCCSVKYFYVPGSRLVSREHVTNFTIEFCGNLRYEYFDHSR